MERNTTEFESPLHYRLWLEVANLIPFEVSTAWITDEVLLESCRQFYNYIVDGYDDILEYPTENYVDPYDPVLESHPRNRDIIWDSMGGHRNFHKDVLSRIFGVAFDVTNDSIIIKNSDYDKLLKKTKTKYPKTSYIKENYTIPFTFDDFMMNLDRRGDCD